MDVFGLRSIIWLLGLSRQLRQWVSRPISRVVLILAFGFLDSLLEVLLHERSFVIGEALLESLLDIMLHGEQCLSGVDGSRLTELGAFIHELILTHDVRNHDLKSPVQMSIYFHLFSPSCWSFHIWFIFLHYLLGCCLLLLEWRRLRYM